MIIGTITKVTKDGAATIEEIEKTFTDREDHLAWLNEEFDNLNEVGYTRTFQDREEDTVITRYENSFNGFTVEFTSTLKNPITHLRIVDNSDSKLDREVLRICNSYAENYYDTGVVGVAGFLKDLAYGGCSSGMVGGLIYYSDTVKFYKRHKKEIQALLVSTLDDLGVGSPAELFGNKWDKEDPFCEDTFNQNLLAWFAFEETARRLASDNGIDV